MPGGRISSRAPAQTHTTQSLKVAGQQRGRRIERRRRRLGRGWRNALCPSTSQRHAHPCNPQWPGGEGGVLSGDDDDDGWPGDSAASAALREAQEGHEAELAAALGGLAALRRLRVRRLRGAGGALQVGCRGFAVRWCCLLTKDLQLTG